MNLTGFCSGDPEDCGQLQAGMMRSSVPDTPFNAAISNALYRIIAAVGSRACACAPELGFGIADLLGLPIEITVPVLGTITTSVLGSEIGLEIKSRLCPGTSCL